MQETLKDRATQGIYNAKQTVKNTVKKPNPTDPKFANKTMGMVTQGTLCGVQEWTTEPDGSFKTVLGIWRITVRDGHFIMYSKHAPAIIGTHPLAMTMAGRMLNLYLTMPAALKADQELREALFAASESE